MKKRKSKVERKTKETQIKLELTVDGSGKSSVKTGNAFFDHMLTLFSKHGLFDLKLKAKGDLEVDLHHTVEDVGICLGQAFSKALGKKIGIERYAEAKVPMDEALAEVIIDVSGRPHLTFNVEFPQIEGKEFDAEVVREFFEAFVLNAGITLHINLLAGRNTHHIIEAVYKAFGVSLSRACAINPRKKGVPSTKGVL
ncbi:MAG: imidazoleglycerol-phosphate dehydratase HisB [Candidatus Margulisiibacteriota bacterium]|nr:imidazoleglycerol-phosphate dehydratase HisB [Candidatus Margulisiibacteriota bacterium]